MIDLRYADGDKFTSKAFRRGDSEEIKNAGSTFATILTSGTWDGAGFRAYIDIMKDEDVNITALLMDGENSDTSDDNPHGKSNIQKIQKRMGEIPTSFSTEQAKGGGAPRPGCLCTMYIGRSGSLSFTPVRK